MSRRPAITVQFGNEVWAADGFGNYLKEDFKEGFAAAIVQTLELNSSQEIEVLSGTVTNRRVLQAANGVNVEFAFRSRQDSWGDLLATLSNELADPQSELRSTDTFTSYNDAIAPSYGFLCPPGSDRPAEDSTCQNCQSGKFASLGQSTCGRCEDALKVPNDDSTDCVCPEGTFSEGHWVSCFDGNFAEDAAPTTTCTLCPPCAECKVGEAPTPKPGYKLAESLPLTVGGRLQLNFFACPYADGCLGGTGECLASHKGALCASCENDSLMNSETNTCESCDEVSVGTPIIVLGLVIVVSVLVKGLTGSTSDANVKHQKQLVSPKPAPFLQN